MMIPISFRDQAIKNIEAISQRAGIQRKIQSEKLASAMWDRFGRWFVATATRLSVPAEIMERAWSRDASEISKSAFLFGLMEAWYLITRASREKKRVEENDGRDLVILAYATSVHSIITNETGWIDTAQRLLEDGENRITDFASFREWLYSDRPVRVEAV